MLKVSVIVPTLAEAHLRYLLRALSQQVIKPYEVVLVIKGDNKFVEGLCDRYGLRQIILSQSHGYFTHALNMGKSEASGDILIFTDADAMPPKGWVKKYVKLHEAYPRIAGIGSRDIYVDANSLRLLRTPDDLIHVRLYRHFIVPVFKWPHPLLNKYKLGVYLTKSLHIVHGLGIPNKTCYSLLFRGVNMSFKASYASDMWFPEHPLLKRAPGNEQYFGLQFVLKGLDAIYVPDNPVLHIAREESLSRTERHGGLERELEVMRSLCRELITRYNGL